MWYANRQQQQNQPGGYYCSCVFVLSAVPGTLLLHDSLQIQLRLFQHQARKPEECLALSKIFSSSLERKNAAEIA
jgi:hypothetical protein